ncbi:MAG: hypothetical protein ACOYOU_05590 [Kiritimatiellia bacterium]
MYSLTTKLIPVRGALACGSLYADTESHLFFGNALIESYEYGDSQDWIGLILAPSAAARLRDVGLPPEERLDYACWQVSFKEESEIPQKELFACLFAGAVDGQSRAFCIHQLQEMKRLAEKGTTATPKDNKEMLRKVAKHTRTLSFLEQNVRVRVADTDRH